MAGISGRTNNKLFRVKTRNIDQPYQIGKNGVTDVTVVGDFTRISYTLDEIDYITFTKEIDQKKLYSKERLLPTKINTLVRAKKSTNRTGPGVIEKQVKNVSKLLKFEPDLSRDRPVKLIKYIKPSFDTFEIENKNSPPTSNDPTNFSESNIGTDTLFLTKKLSFDDFIDEKIFKNDKYAGLISKPTVSSEVFMERDFNSVFEKHQRLSEINNISSLVEYRNGYFNVINNI